MAHLFLVRELMQSNPVTGRLVNRSCLENRRQSMNSPAGVATWGLSLPSASAFKGPLAFASCPARPTGFKPLARPWPVSMDALVQPRPPMREDSGATTAFGSCDPADPADPSDLSAFGLTLTDLAFTKELSSSLPRPDDVTGCLGATPLLCWRPLRREEGQYNIEASRSQRFREEFLRELERASSATYSARR